MKKIIKMVKKKDRILYYNNGDREMGNYLNGMRKGKHVKLHANGEVTSEIYF